LLLASQDMTPSEPMVLCKNQNSTDPRDKPEDNDLWLRLTLKT
jgi:hypothetical protein